MKKGERAVPVVVVQGDTSRGARTRALAAVSRGELRQHVLMVLGKMGVTNSISRCGVCVSFGIETSRHTCRYVEGKAENPSTVAEHL